MLLNRIAFVVAVVLSYSTGYVYPLRAGGFSAYDFYDDYLVQNAPSGTLGSGWAETDPTFPAVEIYAGVGYYYDEDVYTRPGQKLVFNLAGFVFLRVDIKFGDGPWQTLVDEATVGVVVVDHPWSSQGTYDMEMSVYDSAGDRYDHAYTVYVVPPADRGFSDAGNRMVLWESGNGQLDNPLIVVEGFDPTNDNNTNVYYQKGISNRSPFDELRAEGQDVIVLNFADGGADLAANAQVVKDAVNYIDAIKSGNARIKLGGVSMGGVISRYALAEAEQEGSPLNVSHFVSLDSPQQYAVIDSLLQVYQKRRPGESASLESMAAKQLLRFNAFDETEGQLHESFYNTLNGLNGDGYPHRTKNIGVAFSPNYPAYTSPALWLLVQVTPSDRRDEYFFITPGRPIQEPGSFLPINTTLGWGYAGPLGFGLFRYELERYANPTFIPHKSALDLDANGDSKFDETIHSSTHNFHDSIPEDIIDPLFEELGLVHEFVADIPAGWSLVGLPLDPATPVPYELVYPDATDVQGYEGGYVPVDEMDVGEGYWMQYPAAANVTIGGSLIEELALSLTTGWQFIAGPSCDVPFNEVDDPDSIIQPNSLYSFDQGYVEANVIEQGKGYWIKTNASGSVGLSCGPGTLAKAEASSATVPDSKIASGSPSELSGFGAITIRSGKGERRAGQTLYFAHEGAGAEQERGPRSHTLPPQPPTHDRSGKPLENVPFDVRFKGDSLVTRSAEAVIRIQASSYPLTVSASDLGGGHVTLTEMVGKKKEGRTYALSEGDQVQIEEQKIKRLRLHVSEAPLSQSAQAKQAALAKAADVVVPDRVVLEPNYPNPFNPTTEIRFALPEAGETSLVVYDVMGRGVARLLDGRLEAGYHEATWDATGLPSGVYFYRLTAGGATEVRRMVLTK